MKRLHGLAYSKSLRNVSNCDNGMMTRSCKGRINSNIPPLSLGSGGEDNNCYTGIVIKSTTANRNLQMFECVDIL